MAVRTAYAGTAGAVLTAANLNKLAGGWIGYAEATTTQSGITTVTDLTSLTVTVTVGTGRRIKITGSIYLVGTVANDVGGLGINESTTVLQNRGRSIPSSGVGGDLTATVVLTPSSGAHTYKLTLGRDTGTGTLSSDASSTRPAFILVEDLGSTP